MHVRVNFGGPSYGPAYGYGPHHHHHHHHPPPVVRPGYGYGPAAPPHYW